MANGLLSRAERLSDEIEQSMHRGLAAETALVRLFTSGARRGSTWLGRLGDIGQQPPVWAGLAAGLTLLGGPRGRRAAARGSACYLATGFLANLVIKPVVRRSRPPAAGRNRLGPLTSSFPSGHAATDLAFSLGAAQEIPVLFVVLTPVTLAAHWSLIRSRAHYPTDVFVGGALGVAVVVAAWTLWPPRRRSELAKVGDNTAPDGDVRP